MGPEIVQPPPRCASTPKAFPSGGRCPSAHTGADEGATLYPTFPCRKEGGSRLSPQRKFSSAPLGNPVAPSSVTFGDSFPPRGSLWVVQPYTKKRPKSGHGHGPRNSLSTGTMWHPTPKRASANERALSQEGRGPSPATLCVRAFSRESLDPRPGPGGKPPRRCQPAPVPVGAATDDGDPQGAAPRGTVRATTTQRVRSTLSGSRPESGGKPPRRC